MPFLHVLTADCLWIAMPKYLVHGNQNFAYWNCDAWMSDFTVKELIYLPEAFVL